MQTLVAHLQDPLFILLICAAIYFLLGIPSPVWAVFWKDAGPHMVKIENRHKSLGHPDLPEGIGVIGKSGSGIADTLKHTRSV